MPWRRRARTRALGTVPTRTPRAARSAATASRSAGATSAREALQGGGVVGGEEDRAGAVVEDQRQQLLDPPLGRAGEEPAAGAVPAGDR